MRKDKKKFMALGIILVELFLNLINALYVGIFTQFHRIIIGLDTNVFCGICLLIVYITAGVIVAKRTLA